MEAPLRHKTPGADRRPGPRSARAASRGGAAEGGRVVSRSRPSQKAVGTASHDSASATDANSGVRLQKYLADAGVASRRACETIIRSGRVRVNGALVREMGSRVRPGLDEVSLDGRRLNPLSRVYVALHKPPGYLCSRQDPDGRPLVSSLLPDKLRHLFPVGRLDFESEGLLLLTNDGEFCLRLTHPRYGVRKRYWVTLHGGIRQDHLRELERGVFVDGERLRAQRARVLRSGGSGVVVEVDLVEGRNRELRRMFKTLNYIVTRLKRVQIGSVRLDHLPLAGWRLLTSREVRELMGVAGAGREIGNSPVKRSAEDAR